MYARGALLAAAACKNMFRHNGTASQMDPFYASSAAVEADGPIMTGRLRARSGHRRDQRHGGDHAGALRGRARNFAVAHVDRRRSAQTIEDLSKS